MAACRRCGGLLLEEDEYQRCVNCGHREFDEGEPMPRFLSEESRQRWMASRWGGKAKAKAKAKRPDPLPDDLPLTTKEVAVSPVNGVVVATLDDKIAQLQADLAVLEQAREILSRS